MAIGVPGWFDNPYNKEPKNVPRDVTSELILVKNSDLYLYPGQTAFIRGKVVLKCWIGNCNHCKYRLHPLDYYFEYPETLSIYPGYSIYNGGRGIIGISCR